jgi:PHD/YefM family antitoxin component YafN of YafNO toxin-antitoxin module
METVIFKSDEARKRWRDMMDAALTGKEVVIERYDKPQAVLLNYQQWETWKRQRVVYLDELSKQIDDGEYLTHEQVMADLRERGLIA